MQFKEIEMYLVTTYGKEGRTDPIHSVLREDVVIQFLDCNKQRERTSIDTPQDSPLHLQCEDPGL